MTKTLTITGTNNCQKTGTSDNLRFKKKQTNRITPSIIMMMNNNEIFDHFTIHNILWCVIIIIIIIIIIYRKQTTIENTDIYQYQPYISFQFSYIISLMSSIWKKKNL